MISDWITSKLRTIVGLLVIALAYILARAVDELWRVVDAVPPAILSLIRSIDHFLAKRVSFALGEQFTGDVNLLIVAVLGVALAIIVWAHVTDEES